MTHIIDVLQTIAPIVHWTIMPVRDASGDTLSFPPFVAWTFWRPSEMLAQRLRESINSFQGSIAWELVTTGRRWVLTPAKVREVGERDGCDWGLVAAARLKETEPDFGKDANAELRRLAEHIKRQMIHAPQANARTVGNTV